MQSNVHNWVGNYQKDGLFTKNKIGDQRGVFFFTAGVNMFIECLLKLCVWSVSVIMVLALY